MFCSNPWVQDFLHTTCTNTLNTRGVLLMFFSNPWVQDFGIGLGTFLDHSWGLKSEVQDLKSRLQKR